MKIRGKGKLLNFNIYRIYIYALLSVIFVVYKCQAACPNACNGHGTCGIGNVCACFEGWNGGAADCSMRECKLGTAWADKAYDIDRAHQLTECSGRGICDRNTGLCSCFQGFAGTTCQRST